MRRKRREMNDQSEKPTKLAIDVEQWRRDIQTFAETTSRALNAIAAELSNECSTGRATTQITSNDSTDPSFKPRFSGDNESEGEQRLAKLKSQLAERLKNSN